MTTCAILLEDGTDLLLEDGTSFLLEDCVESAVADTTTTQVAGLNRRGPYLSLDAQSAKARLLRDDEDILMVLL